MTLEMLEGMVKKFKGYFGSKTTSWRFKVPRTFDFGGLMVLLDC